MLARLKPTIEVRRRELKIEVSSEDVDSSERPHVKFLFEVKRARSA